MSRTILTATTSATQSSAFRIHANQVPVSVHVDGGIASNENADLQKSHDQGTTWVDVYQDGSQTRLTSTNNIVAINSPGYYRVDKEATASATGVYLDFLDASE